MGQIRSSQFDGDASVRALCLVLRLANADWLAQYATTSWEQVRYVVDLSDSATS